MTTKVISMNSERVDESAMHGDSQLRVRKSKARGSMDELSNDPSKLNMKNWKIGKM